MKNIGLMNTIRWSARITGALLTLICLIFFIGYAIEDLNKSVPDPGLELYNVILFIAWGIGLAALILGWWKEGLGGIISFISFIIFNILAAVNPVPGSGYTIILLIFFIPSILFITYWWLKRKSLNNASEK